MCPSPTSNLRVETRLLDDTILFFSFLRMGSTHYGLLIQVDNYTDSVLVNIDLHHRGVAYSLHWLGS